MDKIIKTKYILINKNQGEPKIFKKDKIQELITQNEEYIKNYEVIKEKTDNPLKKKECDMIISKYRKNQAKLHNKLNTLNSLLNASDPKNMMRAKSQYENKNNLYLKEYLNYKKNSSLKSSFNLNNNLFTKNSNTKFVLKKQNGNNNLSMNKISDFDNSNKNKRYILKEPTKINDIFTNKKELNSNKKNKNKDQLLLNASHRARYGDNEQEISSSVTTFSSTKIDNQKKNNKLYPKSNAYFNNNTNDYYLGNYLDKSNKNRYFLNSNDHIVNNHMKKKLKNIIKIIGVNKKDKLDFCINDENSEKLELTVCDKNKEFNSNPNLFLKQRFFKVKNNVILEFYNSYRDNNELYVAMNENSILGYNIKIIKFKSRNFVTRLKRHKNRIIIIKHYFNYKKKQDFILSGDVNYTINLWNVSNKENPFVYNIKYIGNNIYNFLQICIEEKENEIDYYLLIYDNTINMYHLNKGMFIKNINHFPFEEEKIINLISWKNKNNKLDYIIKCTKHRIIIFNSIDEDIVFQLSNKISNEQNNKINQKVDSIYKSEGYIISNKISDYLCIFTSDMNIEIYDLYNLSLKESISLKINLVNDIHLVNFIPWNNKYTLIINENYIYVFDIENKIIISKMIWCYRNTNRQIYYKKIISNIYGQSLLFWCNNKCISLLSSNDFSIKVFD